MPQELLISKVQMPEHGVFAVRVDETLLSSGAVSAGTTGRFIVSLDYGEDAGTVIETAPYDSMVHGDRIPGFRLLRPFAPQDEKTVAENEARAEKMRTAFLAEVQTAFPELRVPYARLSFGRRKLFLRYICEQQRPNLSAAQEALRRQFGVEVSLWAMGPRDEVAEKVSRLPRRSGISVRTALVYEGQLAPIVEADGYFDAIVPFAKLLGLN